MATIGLDKLFYAKITEDAEGNETYAKPKQLAKAISADLSVELNEAILYADDGQAEAVKEFKGGTLSLSIDDIGPEIAADLVGATLDNNGVLISGGEDSSTPVAVGFRARKANGKYKYYWLYRVLFGVPATNLATKGDSITFSTPTIEGTISRRNKLDGQNKHPWKAEVTEAGENTAIINKWYDAVYEPKYKTAETSGGTGASNETGETSANGADSSGGDNESGVGVGEPLVCTFDGTSAVIASDARVKVTGNQTTGATVTIAELDKTLTQYLKMESTTQVAFSTVDNMTLKIYVDGVDKKIKVDGVTYTSAATAAGDNVVTLSLSAGAHTITKGDAIGVYALQFSVDYTGGTTTHCGGAGK